MSRSNSNPDRKAVLFVTNRRPGDPGGRAEKVATRIRLLERHGWRVVVGYVPEPYVRSFPASLARCLWLARREDADIVNSINNPFHLHVVGFLVSAAIGTPWLAELRDPIHTHPDREPGTPTTRAAALVERLVVREADQVVWYDGIQLPDDYFKESYPNAPTAKFYKLPFMGYERGMFERAPARKFEKFTITYAGSFYEGWIEPYEFIEGLSRYVAAQVRADLQAQFYGDWDQKYDEAADTAGVAEWIEPRPFVPHEELVPILKGSDALLYVGGDDPGNARNVPSKIWDYVGARVPILAVVDPGFRVAEFVENHGLGIVAPLENPGAIADALAAIESGRFEYDPNPAVFKQYTRENGARILGEILDGVV
jgi:glycosyltransferase involved in cell wall biosynthesis